MLTLKSDEFFENIRAGDLEKVTKLVDSDPSLVNAKYKTGATGILFALYTGHRELAEFLAHRKLDLDFFEAAVLGRLEQLKAMLKRDPGLAKSYSSEGFTALGLGAYLGQKEIVQSLIDNGGDVNATAKNQSGFTALTGAVTNGHTEVAKILVSRGANVNHRYEGGFSPLMIAAHNGNLELTRLLLENGADVQAQTSDGRTALNFAQENGHADVAALLRERGAKQ